MCGAEQMIINGLQSPWWKCGSHFRYGMESVEQTRFCEERAAHAETQRQLEAVRKEAAFNERLASMAAEWCRNEPGLCWCGCHISTTADEHAARAAAQQDGESDG